jgi:hypothetical protein
MDQVVDRLVERERSSFKHVQFSEANVQLTLHEKDTKKIDGVDCIKVEPDID